MRVITEKKLLNSLFAEIQSIAVENKKTHWGEYRNWCVNGEDIEQAIKNIFADDNIFKPTIDIGENNDDE